MRDHTMSLLQAITLTVLSTNLTDVDEFKGKFYGKQSAGMHNGGDFPTAIKVTVERGHEYPPGEYTFAPSSFIADEFGNVKLKRVKLLPLGGASAPKK